MTTSEHADLIAALERKAVFFERMVGQGENETHALLRQAAAALASTPSPAQPTEANERDRVLRLIAPWMDANGTVTMRASDLLDRLAPSPVQGADDRLALAEIISNQQSCGACASSPPYCNACLEEADEFLAAGFRRVGEQS